MKISMVTASVAALAAAGALTSVATPSQALPVGVHGTGHPGWGLHGGYHEPGGEREGGHDRGWDDRGGWRGGGWGYGGWRGYGYGWGGGGAAAAGVMAGVAAGPTRPRSARRSAPPTPGIIPTMAMDTATAPASAAAASGIPTMAAT